MRDITLFLTLCLLLFAELEARAFRKYKPELSIKLPVPKSTLRAFKKSLRQQGRLQDYQGRGWSRSYPVRETDQHQRRSQKESRYPHWNPHNPIMSPRYGGNYGYGAYGQGFGPGPSPFAQSVQNMGYSPSHFSRGFGKQGMVAVGVGAMGGMALGYGLGSFPRPHFDFHSPQEEYYYNHYMHCQYGMDRCTGLFKPSYGNSTEEETPPILLKPLSKSYDDHVGTCMMRRDMDLDLFEKYGYVPRDMLSIYRIIQYREELPELKRQLSMDQRVFNTLYPQRRNGTTFYNPKPKADKVASIFEIGYPALIEQLKARNCLSLYMEYTKEKADKQLEELYNSAVRPATLNCLTICLLCVIGALLV